MYKILFLEVGELPCLTAEGKVQHRISYGKMVELAGLTVHAKVKHTSSFLTAPPMFYF